MLGVSPATVWRRVHDGTLPQPIRLGGATRWVRDELLEVISVAQAKRTGTGR
jgi:predicted DNA-binding transcriptional regulator AlpA